MGLYQRYVDCFIDYDEETFSFSSRMSAAT